MNKFFLTEMKNLKSYSFIVVILLVHQLLVIFIQNALSPIHFTPQNFFVLELIGKRVDMQSWLFCFLDAGNIVVLWLISRRILTNRFSVAPSLIYAILPWGSYAVIGESFYIYLSFLLMLIFYGLLSIRSDKMLYGSILVIGAGIAALYSSFFLLLLLPAIFILLVIFKIYSLTELKASVTALIVLTLPLAFLIYSNQVGFKSIVDNEIRVFQDPGLLNTVNSYQGAASQQGFNILAKFSENKYIFYTEHILLKLMKQFTPTALFTSQERLLNFSFSPPVYLGFLIPFIWGLYQILKFLSFRKIFLIFSLLTIPSVLAKQAVDLNRLVIIAPVIILVISYGLERLYAHRKNKVAKIFLVTALFLVVFQVLVTLDDIRSKEKDRFVKYFDQNYEIGKQ